MLPIPRGTTIWLCTWYEALTTLRTLTVVLSFSDPSLRSGSHATNPRRNHHLAMHIVWITHSSTDINGGPVFHWSLKPLRILRLARALSSLIYLIDIHLCSFKTRWFSYEATYVGSISLHLHLREARLPEHIPKPSPQMDLGKDTTDPHTTLPTLWQSRLSLIFEPFAAMSTTSSHAATPSCAACACSLVRLRLHRHLHQYFLHWSS